MLFGYGFVKMKLLPRRFNGAKEAQRRHVHLSPFIVAPYHLKVCRRVSLADTRNPKGRHDGGTLFSRTTGIPVT